MVGGLGKRFKKLHPDRSAGKMTLHALRVMLELIYKRIGSPETAGALRLNIMPAEDK